MDKKEDKNKTVFVADKVAISGPRQDGNYRVAFDIGEYQYNNIKDLPLLNGKILYVAVVPGDEFAKKKKDAPVEDQPMEGIRKITE